MATGIPSDETIDSVQMPYLKCPNRLEQSEELILDELTRRQRLGRRGELVGHISHTTSSVRERRLRSFQSQPFCSNVDIVIVVHFRRADG